ncbi:hypothetical protein FDV58_33750 [Bradyrhizobium elkanii]|uniref:Uncharacterized protein n=1 Tax=Bradyrhizobium elkanii TaxID=29448 RepID=A0A4U6RJ45_BRAEL|nr:hypothetical protein [Bradyrhizobium elkanii]TKV74161.1 hypothetical protein FDV58_33750 [Bradyrhizobium elkanii]
MALRGVGVGRSRESRAPVMEHARTFELIQGGWIHIERLKTPFLREGKAVPAEYTGELEPAIERGWLEKVHRSGMFIQILLARSIAASFQAATLPQPAPDQELERMRLVCSVTKTGVFSANPVSVDKPCVVVWIGDGAAFHKRGCQCANWTIGA